MKKISQLIKTLFLISLLISAKAQIPHITSQIPDSLVSPTAFEQLDTSSLIHTGVLWDRISPQVDFYQFSGLSNMKEHLKLG